MADEAVTEAAPAAATATETPAAAPAAPASPAKNESLLDKMERLGWEKDAKYDAVPDSLGAKARATAATGEEEEPTKPEVPKPKEKPAEKPKEAPDPNAAKLEQLKALSAELGLVLEDGRVTAAERHQLRAQKREVEAAIARREAESLARIEAAAKAEEERRTKDAPRLDRLTSFEKAVEEGDHEAMAKVAGFDSWDKFQEHIISLKADPAYKHLQAVKAKTEALEREIREKEEKAQKAAEEETARQLAAQQQKEQWETRKAYMDQLSAQMAQSTDPLVKAMADDPSFVGAVFRVQQENWDGEQTLTPEQAIRKAAKGAQNPLMAELKKLYDRLSPVFGAPAAASTTTEPKAAPVATKKPRTPEPTRPPAPSKGPSGDQAWKESARRRLEEAAALDRRANGAR